MDDASRAVLALTNRLVDVGVSPLRASELWRLLDEVEDPAQLVGRTAAELTRDFDGRVAESERIATLLDSGTTLAVRLDALRERGIWIGHSLGGATALRAALTNPGRFGAGDAVNVRYDAEAEACYLHVSDQPVARTCTSTMPSWSTWRLRAEPAHHSVCSARVAWAAR